MANLSQWVRVEPAAIRHSAKTGRSGCREEVGGVVHILQTDAERITNTIGRTAVGVIALTPTIATRVDPWWDRLPGVLAELAERWELVVGDAVGRGNTSFLVRCRYAGDRPALLKLTPDAQLGIAEASALRGWESSGHVPQVWRSDTSSGAILLEALPSETPLSETGIAVDVDEVGKLISALHRTGSPVVADGVASLAERVEFIFDHWVGRLDERREVLIPTVSADHLRRGRDRARALLADADGSVLLHGDLHPGNVIDGGVTRGRVAIDPRPCVGDAAFDAVDWVFWPADDRRAWETRTRALSLRLALDHYRLWAWCEAFAAMSAAGRAARGVNDEQTAALLAIAP